MVLCIHKIPLQKLFLVRHHIYYNLLSQWVKLRVSCQKGPTRHAYAWQIGPFWQDTLEIWPWLTMWHSAYCTETDLLSTDRWLEEISRLILICALWLWLRSRITWGLGDSLGMQYPSDRLLGLQPWGYIRNWCDLAWAQLLQLPWCGNELCMLPFSLIA